MKQLTLFFFFGYPTSEGLKLDFRLNVYFVERRNFFLDETGTNAENEIRKFLTTLEKSNFSISSELFSAKQS